MARFSTTQRKTARSEITQYRDVLTGNQTRPWKIASKQKTISIRACYTSMVNRCVAAGCGNVATVTISVFTFPFDVNLRRKWVTAVRQNRKGWDGPGTAAVLCSAHFTAETYRNLPVSIPNSNYVYARRYFFAFWPPCCIRFQLVWPYLTEKCAALDITIARFHCIQRVPNKSCLPDGTS